jgi:hypothetical protein
MTARDRVERVLRLLRIPMVLAVAAIASVLVSWPATRSVHANGVPTFVPLSYLAGLSNWGPEEAEGELELSFAEGYARLTVAGLPQLTTTVYQGWLVNSESNDAISIGRFNADASKNISHEGTLPTVTDFGFDLFVLTVEPDPDDAPQPTSNRSIGGRFALVGDTPVDADTPGDVGDAPGDAADAASDASDAPGDASDAPGDISTQPSELPDTGVADLLSDVKRTSLLIAVMALSVFVGVRLGRRHT